MIFEKLKMENFLSYEKEEIVIKKGLHLISGWNFDAETANGSGKSAIVDAICWTITGEVPRKVSADSIISWNKGKGCKSELHLKDGKNKYKVVRGRSPGILEFYVNDEKYVGESVTKTQEFIERTLGINYNLFVNSVYFAQNSQVQFVTANDNTKKELLTELLALNIFDEMSEKVKEKIKEREQEKVISERALENSKSVLDTKRKEIEKYSVESDGFEEKQKSRITLVEKEIEEVTKNQISREKELRLQLDGTLSFLTSYKTEREGKASELACQEGSLETLRAEIISKEREKSSYKDFIHNYESETNKNIYSQDVAIREIKTKASYKKVEADKIMSEIKKIDATGEGNCSVCYQPISKEVLGEKQKQLAGEAYNLVIEIRALNEEALSKETEKNKLIEIKAVEVNKINEIIKTIDDVANNLRRNEATAIGLIRNLKIELSKIDSEIREKEFTLSKIREELGIIGTKSQEKLKSCRERIDGISQEKNPYHEVISNIKKVISETEVLELDLTKKVAEIKEELLYEEFLKEAFGNRGIKAYVFEQVVNEINTKSNDNLAYLFDDNVRIEFKVKDTKNTKGEISHKFETSLVLDGKEVEFGSLSGGEKRRIILAVDLAVSQIIQNRSSRAISLLIFDEYFEGLDNIGKEKTMELLKRIENTSIFVIDHSTSFQNLFDSEIKVEKKDKISRIV